MWKSSRDAKSLSKASLPDGIRIYAIGDIHGRTDLLRLQLSQIEADEILYPCSRSIAVFLGDYIDRGPDTRGTIDLLLACAYRREVVFLKGNHETLIRRFLDHPDSLNDWRSLGGLETLMSYGLRPSLGRGNGDHEQLAEELRGAMPPQHLAFLDSLPTSFTCGGFFFAHAGVRPGLALARQCDDDLLWIRDDFLRHNLPFEKFIVHGHTPVDAPEIHANRLNVDTGAFATGRLSCVAIEGEDIVPLRDIRSWTACSDTRKEDAPTSHAAELEAPHWIDHRLQAHQDALRQETTGPL